MVFFELQAFYVFMIVCVLHFIGNPSLSVVWSMFMLYTCLHDEEVYATTLKFTIAHSDHLSPVVELLVFFLLNDISSLLPIS